ncbi:hypothetical protein D3C87_2124900 [compost metagenome]
MNKRVGKYPVKLTHRFSVNAPFFIDVPKFPFTIPTFQFQITMIVEAIYDLRRAGVRCWLVHGPEPDDTGNEQYP